MRAIHLLLVLACVTVSATPRAQTPPAPRPAPQLADVLARAGAWVEAFEKRFSSVVAEERYVQLIKPWFGVPRAPSDDPELTWTDDRQRPLVSRPNATLQRRQIRSDVLLVQLPGERWTCYRDVFEADGRPVRNRDERVKRLFLPTSAEDQAQLRRIADESARYNLGSLLRNFNVPTFPLLMAHPRQQPRVVFGRERDETIAGDPYWVLSFKEQQKPTMVRTAKGQDVPIEGRLWIAADTGRIARARVDIDDKWVQLRSMVQTEFGEDPAHGTVPLSMWEWYKTTEVRPVMPLSGSDTYVECLATYSGFRRFQVTTSEKIK